MSATSFKAIEVALRANLAQWSPNMRTAANDVKHVDQAVGGASTTTSKFGAAAGAALLSAGVAAGAFAVKAANAYVDYGKTIMGLSRISGENVEVMSKWNFAAQQSGVASATLSTGIRFLEKSMAAGRDTFDKLGVSTKNANGTFRSTHEVFLDTADAISKMSNATEKNAAITEIFGRQGQQLGALLGKGRQGILELEASASKYGLVLTQNNIPAIQANIKAHRNLDAAMQGAQIQIGQHVLPALTAVTEKFAALPGPVADLIVPLGGVAAGLGVLAVVGPKAAAGLQFVTKGMNSTQTAASGGIVLAIAAVTAEIEAANIASRDFSTETFKNIDLTKPTENVNEFGQSLDKLRAEGERLKGLDSVWDKITNANAAGALLDASAQAEEFARHLGDQAKQIDNLSRATGQSGAEIRKQLDELHVDSLSVPFAKLVDVLDKLRRGEIDAATATRELGGSTDDVTESIEAQEAATKELNDAQAALFNPQFAMIDANLKLKEAQDKAGASSWAVAFAYKEYTNAVAIWGAGSTQAQDALWKLNAAQAANEQSTRDVTKANVEMDAAINNLTTAYSTGKVSWEQSQATLAGWVEQGRITEEQARKMAAQLLVAKIRADGLNGSTAKVTVIADFITNGLGAFAAAGFAGLAGAGLKIPGLDGARAAGGPVRAGGTYLVGERGPELFQAGMAGSIVANGKWGAWGGGKTVYEDGSYKGMPDWAKRAHDFAEQVQRQDAMRQNPGLVGKPGWGSVAANPFAGWDPKADFSQWGKPQPRQVLGPARLSGSSWGPSPAPAPVTVQVDLTVHADNYVGDQSQFVDAIAHAVQQAPVVQKVVEAVRYDALARQGRR